MGLEDFYSHSKGGRTLDVLPEKAVEACDLRTFIYLDTHLNLQDMEGNGQTDGECDYYRWNSGPHDLLLCFIRTELVWTEYISEQVTLCCNNLLIK